MLVWWRPSSNGELSIHSGHGWTTQTLHRSPFLRRGKETLRVTVTWSRLYSVNVKLHCGVQWITTPRCHKEPSTPIHRAHTGFICVSEIHADSAEPTFFCLRSGRRESCNYECSRQTLKTDNGVRKTCVPKAMRAKSFPKLDSDRSYQGNFTSARSPSPPVPRWFGRDIWKRYCYKKHTQRRLLCASRPRLTSPHVGKCTLSLTSWAFMVRGANAGYRLLSPLLQKTLTAP